MKAPRRLRLYIWIVLVLNLGVILWGAYVRATGSGAGCGSHWPLCNGVVIPRTTQAATLIEFIHRATSGAALLAVLVLWIWIRKTNPKRQLRRSASLVLVFMILEALIGAGLVLFELVGENTSVIRAVSGALHLANTFLLLSSLMLTAWLAQSGRRINLTDKGPWIRWLALGAIGLILIGSSGAIAALGDTLYPVSSVQEGLQADINPTAHFLVRLRTAHPVIAILVSVLLVTLTRMADSYSSPRTNTAALGLQLILVIQLLAGVVNWLLLAPIWLQIVHLLLADFSLLIFTWWAIETLAEPEPGVDRYN
jgi:heme A synthase